MVEVIIVSDDQEVQEDLIEIEELENQTLFSLLAELRSGLEDEVSEEFRVVYQDFRGNLDELLEALAEDIPPAMEGARGWCFQFLYCMRYEIAEILEVLLVENHVVIQKVLLLNGKRIIFGTRAESCLLQRVLNVRVFLYFLQALQYLVSAAVQKLVLNFLLVEIRTQVLSALCEVPFGQDSISILQPQSYSVFGLGFVLLRHDLDCDLLSLLALLNQSGEHAI